MKYVCSVCGYIYDEEREGTLFSDLPDTWTCPVCTAPKALFEKQESDEKNEPEVVAKPEKISEKTTDESKKIEFHRGDDLVEMSYGELSALCSNLARGAEKQYKPEEAKLFTKLADYFKSKTEEPDSVNVNVEHLANLVLKNLNEEYPAVRKISEEVADRGALRVITWGEKVTKMQQSVLERYKKEGESLVEHTNIWVCTVCGFIYIGENPPSVCPVCKVPDWKFERI